MRDKLKYIPLVLFIVFVLAFNLNEAHAEDVPATFTWTSVEVPTPSATASENCQSFISSHPQAIFNALLDGGPSLKYCSYKWSYDPSNFYSFSISRNVICPSGSTWNGTACHFPTSCTPPTVRQPDGSCAVECEQGANANSGLYDYGTDPANTSDLPSYVCNNGCGFSFSGSAPAYRQLVNGTYHYFAEGSYDGVGATCSGGSAPSLPSSSTTGLPPPTCAAGQAMGQVNGKTVCVNQSTGQPENPNAPKTTSTKVETPETTAEDGTKTKTETVTNSDGSQTVIITTTSPSGQITTQTQYTPSPSSTTAEQPKPEAPDICKANPDIPACKDIDSGVAASSDGLYTPADGDKTFQSIFAQFKSDIEASAIYAGATGFFNVSIPGGACTGLNGSVDFGGQTFTADLTDTLCGPDASSMYQLLAIGLLIAASYLAFRIGFL